MRLILLLVGILMTNLCVASGATLAMANIVLGLKHFPTAEDKIKLEAIVDAADSSADEKALAAVISRIAHKPAAADLAVLEAMSGDGSAPEVNVLAAAVMSINHQPSAESVAALQGMLAP